jgi:hypothetical protein
MTRPQLSSLSRWLCWKIGPEKNANGDMLKTPFDPRTGAHASCDNPASWCDAKTAKAAVDAGLYEAYGIALGKDLGLVIVDFDGCRNSETGEIAEWAEVEIEALDSCTEVSVSGTGVHVLVWGEIPSNVKHTKKHVGAEIYDCDKMFALTGKFINDRKTIEPRDVADLHSRIAAKLVGPQAPRPPLRAFAHNEVKFQKLCNDEFPGWSRSEAVASVLVTLAWLHRYDREKMAEEFEKTKLHEAWKDKWERLKEKELSHAIDFAKKNEPRATVTAAALEFMYPEVPRCVADYTLLPLRAKFDGWFGRGRVSIVGGSSGAGKTSLMCDLLNQQWHKAQFLGHLGAGLRPLIIFADRGELSNAETFDRLGLADAKLPITHLSVCWDAAAAQRILELIEEQSPLPQIVFVEGADALVSDAAKTQVVAPFLDALQRIAAHYHIAIILSVGAPKSKPREQHTLKRDRIFGSQIWPRMADTIVTLEAVGDGTNDRRDLTVQHRNAKPEMFELEFQNGRLVQRHSPADIDALDIWISERDPESWFTRGEAVEAMNDGQTGMKKTKVYDRLSEMVDRGSLQKRWNKERKIEELQIKPGPVLNTSEAERMRSDMKVFDGKAPVVAPDQAATEQELREIFKDLEPEKVEKMIQDTFVTDTRA